jgi:uncharacterized protein YbjT (DUF2867 family)
VFRGAAPEVVYIRAAYFIENWAMHLTTIKTEDPHFYSTITPLDWKLPMVAVRDIASTAAGFLAAPLNGDRPTHRVVNLHGPKSYSPLDARDTYAAVLGREVGVRPVEPKDLEAFFARIFPASTVGYWVEMATGILPGGVMEKDVRAGDGDCEEEITRGTTSLIEAFRGFL